MKNTLTHCSEAFRRLLVPGDSSVARSAPHSYRDAHPLRSAFGGLPGCGRVETLTQEATARGTIVPAELRSSPPLLAPISVGPSFVFRGLLALFAFFFGIAPSVPGQPTEFRRGDSNVDGTVDISDAINTLSYLFLGEPSFLACDDAADANDDGKVDVSDPIFALSFLFGGGPSLPTPGRDCGIDLTGDDLHCSAYPICVQSDDAFEYIRDDQRASLSAIGFEFDPAYPVPGETVTVRVTIRNDGRFATPGVATALYGDGAFVSRQAVDVAAGATGIASLLFTTETEGEHMLSAIVDPDGVYFENDRVDNEVSTRLIALPAPAPETDFSVSDLRIVPRDGGAESLRATVMQVGGPPGSMAHLQFRADGDIFEVRAVGPLEPGRPHIEDVPWRPGGPIRSVQALINPRHRLEEPDPSNNLHDFAPLPPSDLTIEHLTVHAIKPGPSAFRRITVSFRIVNAGQTPVGSAFRTRIDPGDYTIDNGYESHYVTLNSLPEGEWVAVSRSLSVPFDAKFEVSVTVDVDDAIFETNEDNNLATSSFNAGFGEWVSIGPRRMTGEARWEDSVGRVAAIAIDPRSPDTIYVGARACGVWKTPNGGQLWDPVFDAVGTLRIGLLAVDPSQPLRVYVVTIHDGLYRSEDGGETWSRVSDRDFSPTNWGGRFLIDPTDPNRLYLNSRAGIYRSTNFGRSWALTLSGQATGLVMAPSNPRVLYASISHKTKRDTAGVYRTSDGGDNWEKLRGCPGGELPSVTEDRSIYLAVSGDTVFAAFRKPGYELYRTTAGGCVQNQQADRPWEKIWTSEDGAIYGHFFVDPEDARFVYVLGANLFRSTDGGRSFEITSGYPTTVRGPGNAHVDFQTFALDPLGSRTVYAGTDGGLFRSEQRGAKQSWEFIGDGITNVEFDDLSLAATDPALILAGNWDNGTARYDGNTLWTLVYWGDGMTSAFDSTDASIMYAMEQFPATMRRKIGGGRWECIACGLPGGTTCWGLRYHTHPTESKTVIAPCGSLWRARDPRCDECPKVKTTSSGTPLAWESILDLSALDPPEPGSVVRSAVDASVDLYYAGSNAGRVYAGPGGQDWRRVFRHPEGRGVTDVEISPFDPNTVYVSFAGTGDRRIYMLTRSSAAPSEQTMESRNISSELLKEVWVSGRRRSVRVNALAPDPVHRYVVYAATNEGVYRGQGSGGGTAWTWKSYRKGLPLGVRVADIEFHPTTGVLRIVTYGRSAYEANTELPVGSVIGVTGRVTALRVNDVGIPFGPPSDFIDGEVIIKLDTDPVRSFGFKLRGDANGPAHRRMLDLLRDSFARDRSVQVAYVRTGLRTGRIIRVNSP